MIFCYFYRSAHSHRTVKSTNSSGGSSRIPIKRDSSLRAKRGSGSHESGHKYRSGTDEEEPQTLVIEDPTDLNTKTNSQSMPFKEPISQANFDDMPIRGSASTSRSNYPEEYPSGETSSNTTGPTVQKRPFLQRRSSPNKIAVNKANKSKTGNSRSSSVGQYSRSPPAKRPIHSRMALAASAASTANKALNKASSLRSNFNRSSIHKSTPNLASSASSKGATISAAGSETAVATGVSGIPTRSSSHGRTPPVSRRRTPLNSSHVTRENGQIGMDAPGSANSSTFQVGFLIFLFYEILATLHLLIYV